MARGLDHIVWLARDLDGLAETFRRLGFTVGRRNRHPWGTVNHIIQFDGCFLELLGFAEDYRSPAEHDPAAPFTAFCERFLAAASAGAAMLVLRSDDAVADARTFVQEGIGQGRVLPFSRSAQGPDGSDRTVAFTVAFADIPGLGAFVCQHHRPENFWNPAAQRHANGAQGVTALQLGVPHPDASAQALRRFADIEGGGEFVLANGCRIALEDAKTGRPRDAGLEVIDIRVSDLTALKQLLRANTIAFGEDDDAVTVDPTAGGLTRLRFSDAA